MKPTSRQSRSASARGSSKGKKSSKSEHKPKLSHQQQTIEECKVNYGEEMEKKTPNLLDESIEQTLLEQFLIKKDEEGENEEKKSQIQESAHTAADQQKIYVKPKSKRGRKKKIKSEDEKNAEPEVPKKDEETSVDKSSKGKSKTKTNTSEEAKLTTKSTGKKQKEVKVSVPPKVQKKLQMVSPPPIVQQESSKANELQPQRKLSQQVDQKTAINVKSRAQDSDSSPPKKHEPHKLEIIERVPNTERGHTAALHYSNLLRDLAKEITKIEMKNDPNVMRAMFGVQIKSSRMDKNSIQQQQSQRITYLLRQLKKCEDSSFSRMHYKSIPASFIIPQLNFLIEMTSTSKEDENMLPVDRSAATELNNSEKNKKSKKNKDKQQGDHNQQKEESGDKAPREAEKEIKPRYYKRINEIVSAQKRMIFNEIELGMRDFSEQMKAFGSNGTIQEETK